jgi:hypothetical protein
MSERQVTRSRKDSEGDITALCNPGEWWSPRAKSNAIDDIESGQHSYFVRSGTKRVGIRVVNGPKGKYLRTDPDTTSHNNLDDLPDC